MTNLAVSKDLFPRFARLDHAVRHRVVELHTRCQQMTLAELRASHGLNLETYVNQLDPRARTIRLGDNHRGIVMVPDQGETIILVDVLPHDAADRWMVTRRFRVNTVTGAFEIVDVRPVDERDGGARLPPEGDGVSPGLFDHRSDGDFRDLGVDDEVTALAKVLDQDQLLSFLQFVPPGQADAVLMLLGREPVEALYAELTGREQNLPVDPDDTEAALAAPITRAQFHVLTDQADLAEMLAKPLAVWRTYLHPSQRDAAERPTYNGPVRITGGAGTGKTVVALHRAKALAAQLDQTSGRPILFTTFTRNLAQAIERDLHSLGGSDLAERIEVLNVDRLAHQVVTDAEGTAPGVVDGDQLRRIWRDAVDDAGLDHSVEFVVAEWEQVVLAQGIDSRDDYLLASRAGRGVPLDRRQRAQLWKVVEAATGELTRRRQRTHLQLAADAAGYLLADPVARYRHVVVDEAQDLHEAQWRLVRAAVPEGPNDLFIVGDAHQRIYDRRTSLSRVGINIRGRSRKLRINYRTTQEILQWSLAVLGDAEVDDLDGGVDPQGLAEYHSYLHGEFPVVVGHDTAAAMAAALAEQIVAWTAGGVDETEIAVALRAQNGMALVEDALRRAGVACFRLGRDLRFGDGVAIGTMHRMKGLEYRCIAVAGAGADQLPLPGALAGLEGDAAQRDRVLRQERCLLYVACTRARELLWVGYAGDPSPFLPGGG